MPSMAHSGQSPGGQKWLYVASGQRCKVGFSRRLNESDVLDSLVAAGNSFHMVGTEELKERLLKLLVQGGMHKRFWLAERRQQRAGSYSCGMFLRFWLVSFRLLYVKRTILY